MNDDSRLDGIDSAQAADSYMNEIARLNARIREFKARVAELEGALGRANKNCASIHLNRIGEQA